MGASRSQSLRFVILLAPGAGIGALVAACAGRPLLPEPDAGEVSQERRRQYAEAAQRVLEHWKRAANVGTKVAQAGVELCGDKRRSSLGVVALSRDDLPSVFGRQGFWEEFNDAFAATFRLDERVRVLHMTPGGPAEKAGLVIVAVRGRPVRDAENLAALQRGPADASFEVEIDRAGTPAVLRVEAVPECWYDVRITVYDFPNAFATGRTILVTTGLLRFVENDDELALVIGHEFAHNQLGHAVKSFKRSEQEADYVGCYFAARAGYDVGKAIDYRRRLAREFPQTISENASYAHSGTAFRRAALLHTVEEIRQKQRSGAPLVPSAAP